MADSRSGLPPFNDDDNTHEGFPNIPVEIVSDEEMALIEAAIAAAVSTARSSTSAIHSPSCSSQSLFNTRSIRSITLLSKRGISSSQPDIEDLGKIAITQKKIKVNESLLQRFIRNKALAVTDITRMEWCEKQMELSLLSGVRKKTKAMEAGIARHAMLEAEVVKKVKVQVKSDEDRWALKLLNFIFGVKQLVLEGLTRELPVMGLVDGVWIAGVIDEIQMLEINTSRIPMLIDTKTRVRDTIPAEPQRRNGKLQLMCYKFLLDSLISDGFSIRQFFNFFSLNPHSTLSEEIADSTSSFGFTAKTLDDVIRYYMNCCSMLPPTHNQLHFMNKQTLVDSLCYFEFQTGFDSCDYNNNNNTNFETPYQSNVQSFGFNSVPSLTNSDHGSLSGTEFSDNSGSNMSNYGGFYMNNNNNGVENSTFCSWENENNKLERLLEIDVNNNNNNNNNNDDGIKSEELKRVTGGSSSMVDGQLIQSRSSLDFITYPLTSLSQQISTANFGAFHHL